MTNSPRRVFGPCSTWNRYSNPTPFHVERIGLLYLFHVEQTADLASVEPVTGFRAS